MILKSVLIAFTVGIAFCLLTPIASGAYYRDDTFTVPLDGCEALSLWSTQGGILQIDVEVLTEYASIDILLMDEYNWYIYQRLLGGTAENQQFEYYEESKLNINEVSFRFTAPEDGKLYIVLDNTFYPDTENSAYGTFPVDVHITVADVTHSPSIGLVGVAIGLGIAFFVVSVIRRSKKE